MSSITEKSPPLAYGRQWIDEADITAVVDCLRGDWLTQGPHVEQFERALCQVTGARYAVAVASGTAALHLACKVSGVGPGDAGVTAAITFVASANAIAYCGGTPTFADVDPSTGLIDLESLTQQIEALSAAGRTPRVVVPVDMAGQPADLPTIKTLADRYGAKVIEDAAHSLGATYRHGGKTYAAGGCAHSDLAILSFHPVKHVTTAEGGAILTNDESLAIRLRELRTHGIHRDAARLTRPDEGPWYYEQAELGFHYRISDLQCALGISQLDKLEAFVQRRNAIAARYDEALADAPLVDWLEPLRKRPGVERHAYHLYVVKLRPRPGENLSDLAARRKALFLALRERGIFAQVHYIPVPMQPYYNQQVGPGASAFYAACISLPMFPKMTDADVDRVLATLVDCQQAAWA